MAINPLPQPINYAVDVQSPFAAAFEGMKFAAGRETLQAARTQRELEAQARQAAQAQQQQFQSRIDSFFSTPPTQRKYSDLEPLLIGANKQQFDALKQIGDNMSAEQLSNAKKFTGQVLLSFEANPENAKTMLRERLAVEPDPNQKRAFEDILTIAETDPAEAARLVEENGAAAFGKTWYEGIESARKGRREAALAPGALIEANAKADKAVSDAIVAKEAATNAPETAKADAALKSAQAEKARIEALFAEEKAKTDLEKTRADIRKTDADILIAREDNRIKALNAAIAKETNVVRRQELQQKIDDATDKRDSAKREQQATLASVQADIDNFVNTGTQILNTPIEVIQSATGPIASRLPTTSQAVADFEALVETLGSQAFLAQIPKMKGSGALSEKEGDKLQASLQNLSLKQSPEQLKKSVTEAMRLLEKARATAAERAGLPSTPRDVPAEGLTVRLPNGATVTFPTKAAADAYKKAAGL